MRAVKQFGERRFTPAMREADKGKQKSDVDEFRWESVEPEENIEIVIWPTISPHFLSINLFLDLSGRKMMMTTKADGRKITPMGRP